jgi:hypothetical protein
LAIRKNQVNVLDVGSAPGPCLCATIDLYERLARWTNETHQCFVVTHVPGARLVDSGKAWNQLFIAYPNATP